MPDDGDDVRFPVPLGDGAKGPLDDDAQEIAYHKEPKDFIVGEGALGFKGSRCRASFSHFLSFPFRRARRQIPLFFDYTLLRDKSQAQITINGIIKAEGKGAGISATRRMEAKRKPDAVCG